MSMNLGQLEKPLSKSSAGGFSDPPCSRMVFRVNLRPKFPPSLAPEARPRPRNCLFSFLRPVKLWKARAPSHPPPPPSPPPRS